MFIAYVAITVVTAIANFYAAYLDFTGNERVAAVMKIKCVPPSWAVPLGALKAAGALGLLVGFAEPWIGTSAAVGLVLFFVGALIAHLRVRYYRLANWGAFFVLAILTLTANLAH
ncbi:DoxX family protein [Actinomadura darangshiensis]|uniref:DoxX family protein n=1 Tax=Actinomadura darangshiensis TaxID=705336 RepID=A0A4R5B952_9ACTN|nr:DoxX family protein [Actinomadura darangshiensis]TDD81170.1 DoxX family protein [Actinomadura darangshiensis]